MGGQIIDAPRAIGEGISTSTLLFSLREIAEEQRLCREYLGRLVEIEEERRASEREMEAFSRAFMPAAQAATDVTNLDHFRNRDGSFGIHESDGSVRDATPVETAHLQLLTGTGRRKRGL